MPSSKLIVAVVPLAIAARVLAQPAADTCAGAPLVPANTTLNTNNLAATSQLTSAPCSFFQDPFDVWYRFAATSAGTHVFDVFGIDDVDPTLAIYNACVSGLVGCNDDFDDFDLNPQLVLNLAAGQVVYCRIALNFSDRGSFSFRVNSLGGGPGPANDECTAAGLPALSVGVAATGSTSNANTSITLDPDACGVFAGSGGGADVFYTFTPAASGDYTFDTCGSLFDTVLSVHSGCPASDANRVACNDDGVPECGTDGVNSRIPTVALTGGQIYFVRVAGYFEIEPDTGTYFVVVNALGGPVVGACCRGATCASTAADACTGPNSRFAGPASVCNAPGNTTTPCCRGDYNQVGGITVQDIFDFLLDYFAQNPRADVNGLDGVSVQDIFEYLIAYFAAGC